MAQNFKSKSLLIFIIGFNLLLISQISFDISAGIARNQCNFAYYKYNDNSGYHNSELYPRYNTNASEPYTSSPLIHLGLNTEKSKLFNIRLGISSGIYKENVTYTFLSPDYGSGTYTRLYAKGNGYIKQQYIRLEITPTIQIKKFKLLFGIINIEKLTKTLDAKIKAEQSTYSVISKNFPKNEDSIVTFIGKESITINDPILHRGIEGHRTLFFPVSFGLEYEYDLNKSIIVFGSKFLVSYSQSYAATPHNSFMFYASYRFRKKTTSANKEKLNNN